MDTPDKQKKKSQPPQKPRLIDTKWVGTIMPVSFALSVGMSYVSNEALNSAGTALSFVVLFFFIALGIVFDMIGIAAASGTEREFHSMAAHKVRGAREAVWMLRNAEKVSSICNDVVGDICGIISGATGALIAANITAGLQRRDDGRDLAACDRHDLCADDRRQGRGQGRGDGVQQQGAGAVRAAAFRAALFV